MDKHSNAFLPKPITIIARQSGGCLIPEIFVVV